MFNVAIPCHNLYSSCISLAVLYLVSVLAPKAYVEATTHQRHNSLRRRIRFTFLIWNTIKHVAKLLFLCMYVCMKRLI